METYYIWLNELKTINLNMKKKLLEYYGNPKAIYEADIVELDQVLSNDGVESLILDKNLKPCETLQRENERHAIHTLTIADENYRSVAKQSISPIVLYYKGTLYPETVPLVGIIGSRKTSLYGREITKLVCRDYREKNTIIVSGLSKGIDCMAHTETLQNGGITYAFAAHGLDTCYPAEQKGLMEQITYTGAVISQYPVGNTARKYQFIQRNALLSSWIDELVVIEAGIKSGTLTTANSAIKNRKTVYAVPNNIFLPESQGNNILFRKGVKPYVMTKNPPVQNPAKQNPNHKQIVDALKKDPLSAHELSVSMEKNQQEVEEVLMEMELEGESSVTYCGDGKWHYNGW